MPSCPIGVHPCWTRKRELRTKSGNHTFPSCGKNDVQEKGKDKVPQRGRRSPQGKGSKHREEKVPHARNIEVPRSGGLGPSLTRGICAAAKEREPRPRRIGQRGPGRVWQAHTLTVRPLAMGGQGCPPSSNGHPDAPRARRSQGPLVMGTPDSGHVRSCLRTRATTASGKEWRLSHVGPRPSGRAGASAWVEWAKPCHRARSRGGRAGASAWVKWAQPCHRARPRGGSVRSGPREVRSPHRARRPCIPR